MDKVTGISCPCERPLSVVAAAGAVATGYACVLGDAWTVYQGMEGMTGYGVMEVDGVGGRGTKDGKGVDSGRAGMTTCLRPCFGCEGTEAPLVAAACTSAFCAADHASSSAQFLELTPPL